MLRAPSFLTFPPLTERPTMLLTDEEIRTGRQQREMKDLYDSLHDEAEAILGVQLAERDNARYPTQSSAEEVVEHWGEDVRATEDAEGNYAPEVTLSIAIVRTPLGDVARMQVTELYDGGGATTDEYTLYGRQDLADAASLFQTISDIYA